MKKLKVSTVKRYSCRRLAKWIGENVAGYRYDPAYDKLYKKYDAGYLFLCPGHHRVRMIMIMDNEGCIEGTCDELRKLVCGGR